MDAAATERPRPSATDREGERAELFALVRDRSFRRGKFTLASGRESELYFNLKPTMMDPRGAYLGARAFLDLIHAEGAGVVGGLEMGAVPIIGAVAAISEAQGQPVRTFFVRKKAKAYGTQDVVEGLGPGETLAGQRVVIADDVATTGGSILVAVEAARAAGAVVEAALVMVDRDEGAAEALSGHGLRLLSVFKGGEFLS